MRLPKWRVMSGREVCAILEGHGFVEVRRRGSHRIMQKRGGGTTVTAVVPDHRTVRLGTLASIVRQSGLDRRLFEVA